MKNHGRDVEEEEDKGVALNYLYLYGRDGEHKVGGDTGEGNPSNMSWSSASEVGTRVKKICGLGCFTEDPFRNSRMHIFLPDDILEMCLVRLPLTSLMSARLVCKKWRNLITSPHFLQMRREGLYQTSWLFDFGSVENGCLSGVIHAFDASENQWLRTYSDLLEGRFMFSVTSIHENIYIVGGRSSFKIGQTGRSSSKTHKGVLVFSPVTSSWRKIAPMREARSMAIVGISEVGSDVSIIQNQPNRCERRFRRSQIEAAEVCGDPHRLSVRISSDEDEVVFLSSKKSHRLAGRRVEQSSGTNFKRFVLIAFGGTGSFGEQLYSGEIYDSSANTWTEIQRLPVDFGVVCSAVTYNGIFYVFSKNDKLAGYDIERGFWTAIQTSPFPGPPVHESYPKLVSCIKRLFMLSASWWEGGGVIGQTNKAVRTELDLMYLLITEVSEHKDASVDWNTKFVADAKLLFDLERFKIMGQIIGSIAIYDMADGPVESSCFMNTVAVLHL